MTFRAFFVFVALALPLAGCAQPTASATPTTVGTVTDQAQVLVPRPAAEEATAAGTAIESNAEERVVHAVEELQVSVDDVTLHARTAGEPDAENVLIAIHGGPGMSSRYMLDLEQLAGESLAVVTYDQRGAGRSDSPPPGTSSYALSKYVTDLEAVRKAVGAEKVHLLGHSWGGLVALRYAAVHPQRVSSIILMGSGPASWQAAQAAQANRAQRLVELQRQGIIPESLTGIADILPAYFSDPHFEMPEPLRNLSYNPTAEQQTWLALGEFDFTAEVAELENSVLLLWGRDDPFGLSTAEESMSGLAGAQAELVVLEKCGHFWHECPEGFYTEVRTFLDLPSAP